MFRFALSLVFVIAGGTPLFAQGLVQLSLAGAIQDRGGARVEIEIGALGRPDDSTRPVARELVLHWQLAYGTSGPDLAQLIRRELELGRIGAFGTEPRDGRMDLYIDHALYVNLRLPTGLKSIITLAETGPGAVRVLPPERNKQPASISISATTFHGHTEQHGVASLAVELDPSLVASAASDRIHEEATKRGWIGERPGIDAWQVLQLSDGSELRGFCLVLESEGDWRVEVKVPNRVR